MSKKIKTKDEIKLRGLEDDKEAYLPKLCNRDKNLANSTDLSINKIKEKINSNVSRAVVGHIVKRVRTHGGNT